MQIGNEKKALVVTIILLLITTALFPVATAQFFQGKKDTMNDNSPLYKKDRNDIATVYQWKYDYTARRVIKEPLRDISLDEAEKLKQELLITEETYESPKKRIEEQINIMKKWGFLPSDITIDDFIYIKEKLEEEQGVTPAIAPITPGVILSGPSLNSFLTLGGSYFALHMVLWPILPPWINIGFSETIDILNGTRLSGWVGATPVLGLYCPAMTLINTFGFVDGPNFVFSPFACALIVFIGTGIAVSIYYENYPHNVLDWAIGVSLTGVTVFISEIQP